MKPGAHLLNGDVSNVEAFNYALTAPQAGALDDQIS